MMTDHTIFDYNLYLVLTKRIIVDARNALKRYYKKHVCGSNMTDPLFEIGTKRFPPLYYSCTQPIMTLFTELQKHIVCRYILSILQARPEIDLVCKGSAAKTGKYYGRNPGLPHQFLL